MIELKYPLFDGEKLWEGAAVTIAGSSITSVTACDPAELAGASRPEQVLDNIRAAENTFFTDDELTLIDQISH